MKKEVRTRFAPSPTGYLHLGSLRTALFNYLWAKQNKGLFILRLEDTDQSRLVEGAAAAYLQDLRALGLAWDFGPDKVHPRFGSCVQSRRLDFYKEVIDQLLAKDVAYYDYTTPQRLAELRQEAQRQKKAFVFRREMALKKPATGGQKPVVRIAIDDQLKIEWLDIVKGQQSWLGSDIGDFVALKSDGWPTYHLACVVDDHLMQISHVLRADEWLSSTPKHLYLFDVLKWERPLYVHLPPVLSSQGGKKLSKREAGGRATHFVEDGYLASALLNYVSLLGWNPKTTQEVFSLEELVQAFKLTDVQTSGARFDQVRLDWFNGQHLRSLETSQLRNMAQSWWPKTASSFDETYKNQVLELVYQRLKKWSELPQITHFFFQEPARIELVALEKETKFNASKIEELLLQTLKLLRDSDFSAGDLELKLYQFAIDKQVAPSKYFTLLRLKTTGSKVAPGLFETMHVLGKAVVEKRLKD